MLLFIILILFIQSVKTLNQEDENKQKTILSENEKQNLKPWENFSGFKMTEQKREKRFVITTTALLILVIWNIVLGPFTQMQITSKVGLIGTFRKG
uniref:Uncharacterized protein n=1 Tax=Meloidogyne hapla TaxID=6305 RepID=A0A1I8BHQ2_MELHA